MNQIRAPNLIFMLHSAADKELNLEEHKFVDTYLDKFMFTPGAFKFKNITQVANLVLPLLSIEIFCRSKFQKVILPSVLKDPKIGYFLPLSFRLITLVSDTEDRSSQTLHITR